MSAPKWSRSAVRETFGFENFYTSAEESYALGGGSSAFSQAQWSMLRKCRAHLVAPVPLTPEATASLAACDADLAVRIRQFAISMKTTATEFDDNATGPALRAVFRSDVNRALYVNLASRLYMDGEDGWRNVISPLERSTEGRVDGCALLKLIFDDARTVNALQASTAIATAQHGANEIHQKGWSAIGPVVASLRPLADRFSFGNTTTTRVFATMLMSSFAAVTPAEVQMRNNVLSELPEFDLAYIENTVQEVRAIAPIAPIPPYLAAMARQQLPAGNAAPRPPAVQFPGPPGGKKQAVRRPWKELSSTIPEGSYIDRSTGFLKCSTCKGDSGWNHHKYCKQASPAQQQQRQNAPQAFPAAAIAAAPAAALVAPPAAAGAAPAVVDPAVAALMGDFMAALSQLGGQGVFGMNARAQYSLSPVSLAPQPPGMLDSGCTVTAGGSSMALHNPRPAPKLRIQCGTGSAGQVVQGEFHFWTASSAGDECIRFPLALRSPDLPDDLVLISQDQLLSMGYSVFFSSRTSASLKTPGGATIVLRYRDGVWFLPSPSRSHGLYHNSFAPLAMPTRSGATFSTSSPPRLPAPVPVADDVDGGALLQPPASPPPPIPVEGVMNQLIIPSPITSPNISPRPPPSPSSSSGSYEDEEFDESAPHHALAPPAPPLPVQLAPLAPVVPAPRSAARPHVCIQNATREDPRILHVQALHQRLGCCKNDTMSLHIKSMLHDDPDRPSWQAFKRWKQIFTCTQCLEQSHRPPRREAHPQRTNDGSFLPGEFIIADGSGAYKFETINGYTQHFVFSDFRSKARFAFPSKTKSASELVVFLKQFSADSGVAILKFQGDDDIISSEEVRKWARDSTPPVQVSLSPPHVAQPNGAAERGIGVSESVARGAKSRAGSGHYLWPLTIVDSFRSLNIRPHASLPRGLSPLSIWPAMPYQHVSLPPRVWGCRMHSLELDRTDRSTAAGRHSRPLIYVGVSQRARAYLGYDVDSNSLLTVGSDLARFDESVFPLKDMLLQGEAFASDYAIDVDGWRAVALLPADAVNDMQLAEFVTGKQILFRVPSTVFPQESGTAVGTWDMRVLRPSVSRGRDVPKIVSVEMHFEKFSSGVFYPSSLLVG